MLELGMDANYLLRAEKVTSKWWLELIERATGLTWTIYCDTKTRAQTCFKGMSMTECREWCERLKIEPKKVYKAGAL